MREADRLAAELEAQHRDFFQYTGWLVFGAGLVAVLVGSQFIRAARRPTHRAAEARLGILLRS
jgi:hypothetical protein